MIIYFVHSGPLATTPLRLPADVARTDRLATRTKRSTVPDRLIQKSRSKTDILPGFLLGINVVYSSNGTRYGGQALADENCGGVSTRQLQTSAQGLHLNLQAGTMTQGKFIRIKYTQ